MILTQVSCHQIGIVEILHSQPNNVDKILYDLHELHCSRVDLGKIERKRGHKQRFYYFINAAVMGVTGEMQEFKIPTEK